MTYTRLSIAALVLCASAPAGADELPGARHSVIIAAPFARYDRFDADTQGGRAGVSVRALAGERIAYAVGLELDAGATRDSAVYDAELFPIGVGLRFGESGMLAVLGGVGVGGAGDGRPTALQVPLEVRGRAQLGSVRVLAWGTARAMPLDDARELELEASLGLGWGRQRTYWRGASAGSGPYVAVTGRRIDGATSLSVTLGLEIVGGN